jgi:radical SAM superfamily enzyme YgiQ (UPF0313 family)
MVKYNHGIAVLSALCKRKGIETGLYVLDSVERFTDYLKANSPKYVCFSAVVGRDYALCVPFARVAESLGHIVFLGGPWAQLGHKADDCFHAVCRGEGETIPNFMLSRDTRMFKSPLACKDLNSLPLPDYEMFKDIPFDRGLPQTDGKKCLPYYSSRGCPFRCSFCQALFQPPFRVRTKVAEDLGYLRDKYNPDFFFLGDATLPYWSESWRKSWEEFRHPFACYIRADIKPDLLEWLIDRGMEGCAFGVESGDEQYRNEVLHKDLTDEQVNRTASVLDKAGVWFIPFFMRNTPGEKLVHKTRTALMARNISPYSIIWNYEELKWESRER